MQLTPSSKGMLWTGRVMSAMPVLLILMSSVMKLLKLPAVVEGFARSGVPERLIIPVGPVILGMLGEDCSYAMCGCGN